MRFEQPGGELLAGYVGGRTAQERARAGSAASATLPPRRSVARRRRHRPPARPRRRDRSPRLPGPPHANRRKRDERRRSSVPGPGGAVHAPARSRPRPNRDRPGPDAMSAPVVPVRPALPAPVGRPVRHGNGPPAVPVPAARAGSSGVRWRGAPAGSRAGWVRRRPLRHDATRRPARWASRTDGPAPDAGRAGRDSPPAAGWRRRGRAAGTRRWRSPRGAATPVGHAPERRTAATGRQRGRCGSSGYQTPSSSCLSRTAPLSALVASRA